MRTSPSIRPLMVVTIVACYALGCSNREEGVMNRQSSSPGGERFTMYDLIREWNTPKSVDVDFLCDSHEATPTSTHGYAYSQNEIASGVEGFVASFIRQVPGLGSPISYYRRACVYHYAGVTRIKAIISYPSSQIETAFSNYQPAWSTAPGEIRNPTDPSESVLFPRPEWFEPYYTPGKPYFKSTVYATNGGWRTIRVVVNDDGWREGYTSVYIYCDNEYPPPKDSE